MLSICLYIVYEIPGSRHSSNWLQYKISLVNNDPVNVILNQVTDELFSITSFFYDALKTAIFSFLV